MTPAIVKGIPASPGTALGPIYLVRPTAADDRPTTAGTTTAGAPGAPGTPGAPDAEGALARLHEAVAAGKTQLQKLAEAAGMEEAAGILEAQAVMLEDPELLGAVERAVRERGLALERAVAETSEDFARQLEALDDPYIRQRAADIRDIAQRLLRNLSGVGEKTIVLDRPSVVLAEDLTPSETAGLPAGLVLGFAIEKGSETSHTAILAKARGVPAVVGATGLLAAVAAAGPGRNAAVDGSSGVVEIDPGAEASRRYAARARETEEETARLRRAAQAPAVTRDGVRVEVGANIGSPADVAAALESGAEGVGLFRTEFLFMETGRPPDEERQVAAYSEVLAAMGGRPVIIRTLDVGGDKDISYLGLEREANPFLGLRGLRLCLARPELFKTQLRAIYRAGVKGKARVMFPMVSTVEEVREAKALAAEAVSELEREGLEHDAGIPLGVMIETPSAALEARELACEVAFFSVGTNDLTQYTLAVDRTNAAVAHLADPFEPAVLRLVAQVARAAAEAGIRAGMCGELAGDPLATALLVGLGLVELSAAAPRIPRVKENVRLVNLDRAREVAAQALELPSAAEVRRFLGTVRSVGGAQTAGGGRSETGYGFA